MINSTSLVSADKNRPIVVFGEDWGAHPSSTQHLIKVLGQTRSIIWFNSIGLRKPKFTRHDLLRLYNKVKSFLLAQNKPDEVNVHNSSHFVIINPLVIPCADSWLALKVSKYILQYQYRIACKKLAISNPIIWTSLPTSVDYLELFGNAPCVYYCGDDFSSLAGVDHGFVAKKELELIEKSNYIFTASEKLQEKFPRDKVVNIPHGVNFSLFSEQVNITPSDLPKGKPIAGFYGSISTWLDQNLLVQTITALPHWSFVFIGELSCNVDKLKHFPNVYFLGEKPHTELPKYIQNWNVAILPFVNNKQIQMCNPLKLREYIASGTPIVTTDFNALNGYRKYLQISSSVKPFYQAILLANAEITPVVNFDKLEDINDLLALTQVKQCRKACVKDESWENRARDVQRYLVMC
ncbi:glycosyltransferase [Colwellia sp. TT2012]|uniref:glycosyltransferase n=1 Tax=Colwellia sp. TT2012 TaxID=1720342 RepID=UPI0007094A54|nr:glycosyltransferase [Colwellia sp. TT2012]